MTYVLLIIGISLVLHLVLWFQCRSYYCETEKMLERAEDTLNFTMQKEVTLREHLDSLRSNQK